MQAVLERMTPAFVYDPTLVLYLPLRQLDSATFADRSAYGHLVTRSGAVWQPQGTYFDGIDDKINCGSLAALALDQAFTLMMWVKLPIPITASWQSLLSYNRNGTNFYGLWKSSSPIFHFRWAYNVAGTLAMDFLTTISEGNWYHVVGTFNRSVPLAITYLNGLIDRTATPGLPTAAVGLLTIGENNIGSEDFTGQLDDIRIYSRALNPMEIQRIYLETRGQYV